MDLDISYLSSPAERPRLRLGGMVPYSSYLPRVVNRGRDREIVQVLFSKVKSEVFIRVWVEFTAVVCLSGWSG